MSEKTERAQKEYDAALYLVDPVRTPQHKDGPKAKKRWEKELAKLAKTATLKEKFKARAVPKNLTDQELEEFQLSEQRRLAEIEQRTAILRLACKWNSDGIAVPRYLTEMILQLASSSNNSAWTWLEQHGYVRWLRVREIQLYKGKPRLLDGEPLKLVKKKKWRCPRRSVFHPGHPYGVLLVNSPDKWGVKKKIPYRFMGACLNSSVKTPFTPLFSAKPLVENKVKELIWKGEWAAESAVIVALPRSGKESYLYDWKTKTKKKI